MIKIPETNIKALSKIIGAPKPEAVKETRQVIGEKLNLLHTNESMMTALQQKKTDAEKVKENHKEWLEEALKTNEERNENAIKAINTDYKTRRKRSHSTTQQEI